jgi:hypothetical protein
MLPAEERSIIARALAIAPGDRWKTCAEMMAHLSRLADGGR